MEAWIDSLEKENKSLRNRLEIYRQGETSWGESKSINSGETGERK